MWTKKYVEAHNRAPLHIPYRLILLEILDGASDIQNGVRTRSANATESATWRRGCYRPTT